MTKVHGALCADPNVNILRSGKSPEEFGVINQKGLNRKVRPSVHARACADARDSISLTRSRRA